MGASQRYLYVKYRKGERLRETETNDQAVRKAILCLLVFNGLFHSWLYSKMPTGSIYKRVKLLRICITAFLYDKRMLPIRFCSLSLECLQNDVPGSTSSYMTSQPAPVGSLS